MAILKNNNKNETISFKTEEIKILSNDDKINLIDYLNLNNIDIDNIEFSISNSNLGKIENNYFIPFFEGEVILSAKYKDQISNLKISIISSNIENNLNNI